MRIFLMMLCVFFSINVSADAPTCHENSGGNYCAYSGMVNKIYINNSGMILIYFDTLLPIESATAVGFAVTKSNAATYVLQSNPEFAKLLYSTALSARAAGLPINLQMRGASNGYLLIDRIWL